MGVGLMATRGWNDVTAADVAKMGRKATSGPVVKRSKYGAVKDTVNGVAFHSKREAAYYRDLLARLSAGDIRGLKCQPRYALCALVIERADPRDLNAGTASVRRCPVAEYVADFEFEESDRGWGGIAWTLVVADVKGARTDIYKLKKRFFEAQYGTKIREVR